MVSAYVMMFCLFWLQIFWFNAVDFLIINCFLCFYLFSRRMSSSVFHALILTVAMVVTEVIIELVCMRLLDGFLVFTQNSISYAIVSIGSRIFYFFVIRIIIVVFAPKKERLEAKSGFTVLLSVTPLISVWLTLVIVVICMNGHIDFIMGGMLLASMALLLVMNFVVFWAYDSDQKFMRNYLMMQADLKEQQAEAEYYRRLAEQTENQKILIHDIKNHLQTIAGLSEDGGESKIHEYVQQLMEMPEMKSSVTYCSQPVLNVILGQYQEICKKKSIQFGVDIRKDSVDYITVDDLTALFGNLLKNAVEAAAGVSEAYIDVTVNYNYKSKQTFISVENSVLYPPRFDGDGGLISRKNDGKLHGVGIKSIQRAAEHYQGEVSYHYDKEAKCFHMMVLLTNNK
jgi:two-component system, LytTR family, sensor histidine kinase AgrC